MWRAAPVLVTVLVVAGCAAGPPPEPVADPAAPSRPLDAVVAALLPVDPCLGDPDGVRGGPHRCRVDGALVVLGRWRPPATTDQGEVVDLDGVKAYRRTGLPGTTSCSVAVPVGPQLAVGATSDDGTCPTAEAVARLVPAALADPPAPTGTPAAADRDACALLRGALGDRIAGLVVSYDAANFGIDGCAAQRPVDGGVAPVHSLDLRYDALGPAGTPTAIAGKPGGLTDFGDSCTTEWPAGPSGVDGLDLVVVVRAPDCDTGREVAEAVDAALTRPAPPGVEPYPGLLTYRPDEPDSP